MMNLGICEKESDENVAEKCVSTGMTFYHVVGLLVFIFYVSIIGILVLVQAVYI